MIGNNKLQISNDKLKKAELLMKSFQEGGQIDANDDDEDPAAYL